jgi:hypothetical protein
MSSSIGKNILLSFSEIRDYSLPIPPPLEGRIAIVTDVGSGMRWTWGGSARDERADEGILADGEGVWSWSPDAGIKLCG